MHTSPGSEDDPDVQDNRSPTDAPNRGWESRAAEDLASDQTSGQGPDEERATRLRRAERETRRLARSHYENFLVASVLLPRRLRQPFYNLYAFCRTADDVADESGSTELALDGLKRLREGIEGVFGGVPQGDLYLALEETVGEFDLPKEPFLDLLDAFEQDQRVTRYRDFHQLAQYCRRSANPVGRLVLGLGGCDRPEQQQLSDQICTGLQLANFWQDVARDRVLGRVYLPADAMQRHGVTEAMLDLPSASPSLKGLLREECARAERYLRGGLPLAQQVPRWLAADIKLFVHGGLETLSAIRRIDFDVLSRRPTVSKGRQAWLIARAAVGLL